MLKVVNMEVDDHTLNKALERGLKEAKRIGMRGDIVDIAITLKMMRDQLLAEMQSKGEEIGADGMLGSDDEDED